MDKYQNKLELLFVIVVMFSLFAMFAKTLDTFSNEKEEVWKIDYNSSNGNIQSVYAEKYWLNDDTLLEYKNSKMGISGAIPSKDIVKITKEK